MKTPDQILAAGLDKFYTLRPKAKEHINLRTGVYWRVFVAQRAMIALALNRVVDLLASNRLEATSSDLIDFVSSEFTQVLSEDLNGSFATGEVTFIRPALNGDGTPATLPAGDIPRGTVLARAANLTTQIPVNGASYSTLSDFHFNAGQLVSTPVQIQASTIGASANQPVRTDPVPHGVVNSGKAFFDTTILVNTFTAAGGADAFGSAVNFQPVNAATADDFVRRFARAYSKGQYGPTANAALYGAIRGTGARRVVTYDDPSRAVLKILVADQSWGNSAFWTNAVQQSLYDNAFVGFGCQVEVSGVRNKVITVQANVTLRDWNYTTNTLEIDDAIRDAVQAYCDDRTDWTSFRNRALKNAITRAHPKILKCSSVTVSDTSGNIITDVIPSYASEQFHYYIPSRAVTTTYIGPG